jgi:hypothetical protein
MGDLHGNYPVELGLKVLINLIINSSHPDTARPTAGILTIVKVLRFKESARPRIFLVGHNKLTALPPLVAVTEYTSSANSELTSWAGSHIPSRNFMMVNKILQMPPKNLQVEKWQREIAIRKIQT